MKNLTWDERKIKWRLEEIAREEEKTGNEVKIEYGRIKINEEWWIWDEGREVLRNGKRKVRKEDMLGMRKGME